MSRPSFIFIICIILVFIVVVPGWGQTRIGKFGVGADGSMQYVLGAGTTNPSPAIGYGFNLSYSIMEYLGVRSKMTYSPLTWKGGLSKEKTTNVMALNVYVGSDLMPTSNFNIFPFVGGGIAVLTPKDDNGLNNQKGSTDMHYIGGVGFDYFLNEFWSLTLLGEYVITNSRYYAGNKYTTGTGNSAGNKSNDTFTRVSLQVRYYFFDQAFIAKLLEAQRDRLKRSK
jgi:hypothetical protein